VKLWDAATAESLATFEPTAGYDAVFSPDGKTLATTGSRHTIKLWDVRTRRELSTLEGHKAQVLAICFSADGKTLATGSVDHTIRLGTSKSARTSPR
jgi:WD40 repeat protein